MSTLVKYFLCALVAFGVGVYVSPTKTVERIEFVEVEKKKSDRDNESERSKHKETEEKKITRPDGTIEETKKTVEDTGSTKKSSESDTSESGKNTSSEKIVERQHPGVTIAAIGGVKLNDLSSGVSYGVSAYRPFLGPIGLGAGFLTNSTVFVSLGITF